MLNSKFNLIPEISIKLVSFQMYIRFKTKMFRKLIICWIQVQENVGVNIQFIYRTVSAHITFLLSQKKI